MTDIKIIISAIIFIVLTAFKLVLPDTLNSVKPQLHAHMDSSVNYEAAMAQMQNIAGEYYGFWESEEIAPAMSTTITAPQSTPSLQFVETLSFTAEPEEPVCALLPFEYIEPVDIVVSSAFGERIHPVTGTFSFHYGLDLAADYGTDILAFAAGEVTLATYSDSYGYYIIIEHDDTYSSLYAHCDELLAQVGDIVEAGAVIARVGDTGVATGAHLHFEIRENGICIDPMEFFV